MRRLLVVHGEGIGNAVQILPLLKTLRVECGYAIDYWHAFSSFNIPPILSYCDKWFFGQQINKVNLNNYFGYVTTFWARNHVGILKELQLLCKIHPIRSDISEVDTYLNIARDLGIAENRLSWYGECRYKLVEEKFDIVIHNGYNHIGSAKWEVKSYNNYVDVVSKLSNKYKICSVGSNAEYIPGTINKTGKTLLETLGMIKNSKLFIGNDSGLYHCANALGTKNIVIFTATSTKKNYDSRFHRYSTIVARDDLECRSTCQARSGWRRYCNDWICKDIDSNVIVNVAEDLMVN